MANEAITVIAVFSYSVLINKGYKDKVKKGQKYLIYSISDEIIIDPDTRKPIGNLEIVKGIGKVTEVEEHRAFLHSDEFETSYITIKRPKIISNEQLPEEKTVEREITKAFHDVKIGDLVKRIF